MVAPARQHQHVVGGVRLEGVADAIVRLALYAAGPEASTAALPGAFPLPKALRLENGQKRESPGTPHGHVAAADRLEQVIGGVVRALGTTTLTEHELRRVVGGDTGLTGCALRTAISRGLIERSGLGRRGHPYRYRLRSTCSHQPALVDRLLDAGEAPDVPTSVVRPEATS